MKTKIVLYGGFNPTKEGDGNADFSREILREASENPKILIVPFSKEPDRVVPTAERVTKELNAQKWQQKIVTEIATEEDFVNQLQSAEIIYLQGGSSAKLISALKNYPDFEALIKGKIVAGDSGGANVLSKFYYSPSSDSVSEGLGILPIKMIPHYKEEYKDKFGTNGAGLEEVFLSEQALRVFYI